MQETLNTAIYYLSVAVANTTQYFLNEYPATYINNTDTSISKNFFSYDTDSSKDVGEFDSYWDNLCNVNYGIPNWIEPDRNFGYSKTMIPYVVIPVLSLILNTIVIVTSIRKFYCSKNKVYPSKSITQDLYLPNMNEKLMKQEINLNRNNSNLSGLKNTLEQYEDQSTVNEENETPTSSLEKMLFLLTLVETGMAVFWLTMSLIFKKATDLHDKCSVCFAFSLLTIFLQTFDWCFFACILHNLKVILESPLEEKNFRKRLRLYLLLPIGVASGFTFMVIQTNIVGRSPMLTCFINNYFDDDPGKLVGLYCTLTLPFIYVVWCIYTFVNIFKKRKIQNIREVKISTIKLLILSLLYIIFYFPTFLLYLLTINTKIYPSTFYSWLSYYCSLSNMCVNLVLSIGRILEGYVKCSWNFILNYDNQLQEEKLVIDSEEENEYIDDDIVNELEYNKTKNKNLAKKSSSSYSSSGRSAVKRKTLSIIDLSQNLIEIFIKEIFIGVSLTLVKSQKHVNDVDDYKKKYILENHHNYFDSSKRNNDEDFFKKLGIDAYLETQQIYIKVTEYAPKIFKKLRKIDNLDEIEIVSSLMQTTSSDTSSNKGGKSNALFLPTINNRLLIKTMEDPDYQTLIQNSFLTYYLLHLENNPNSIICRFYGVYSVYPDKTGTPLMMILMRNAKGPFKKLIRATFDLKGSTMNRYTNVKKTSTSKDYFIVKKDLNFDEEIGGLNLKKEDKERFLSNSINDSKFFEDQGIMDYSLFIYKLEYTEEEIKKFYNSRNYACYKRYFFKSETINYRRDSFDDNKDKERTDSKDLNIKDNKDYSNEIFDGKNRTESSDSNAMEGRNKENEFIESNNIPNVETERNNSINDEGSYKTGYIIMIIDYLQLYNLNKKFENNMKSMLYRGVASSCPPIPYSERFIDYCKTIAGDRKKTK